MIHVTRLNGEGFVLNAELISEIEATPDTLIRLTSQQTYMVRESVDDVVQAVIEYQRRIRGMLPERNQPGE